MKTIFEKTQKGQRAYSLPKSDTAFETYLVPENLRRKKPLPLPEISEIDLTRHFTELSSRNMGIDNAFYPLGSCTMKFNPRMNEVCAQLPQFTRCHPLAPDATVQGNLALIEKLISFLSEICGMSGGSLAPNAGAQGEFVGLQMIRAYHAANQGIERTDILVPHDAHGTNPATAAMAGYRIIPIKQNEQGELDLDDLRAHTSEKTAGLMLTNPNTLGNFHSSISEVTKIVHDVGGLLYYDGANLNAILNIVRPGEMGFDVMHLNLHKTFSTPHGGGGPGSGPVLCNHKLLPYLPLPYVAKIDTQYHTSWSSETSIGSIASFHGNFGIYLRAYAYLIFHGHYGLRRIAEIAILNANYLKKQLSSIVTVPFKQTCMHEFVVQIDQFLNVGIRAFDVAKRLLDYGIHSPTMYFPLIVKECMLIEPTESESKDTLDNFIHIFEEIISELKSDPELLKNAPHTRFRTRIDEVLAAKKPILNCVDV